MKPGVLIYYGPFRAWIRIGPHTLDVGRFPRVDLARRWADQNGCGFIDCSREVPAKVPARRSRAAIQAGRGKRRDRVAARRSP